MFSLYTISAYCAGFTQQIEEAGFEKFVGLESGLSIRTSVDLIDSRVEVQSRNLVKWQFLVVQRSYEPLYDDLQENWVQFLLHVKCTEYHRKWFSFMTQQWDFETTSLFQISDSQLSNFIKDLVIKSLLNLNHGDISQSLKWQILHPVEILHEELFNTFPYLQLRIRGKSSL